MESIEDLIAQVRAETEAAAAAAGLSVDEYEARQREARARADAGAARAEERRVRVERLRESGVGIAEEDLAMIVDDRLEDTPALHAVRGWLQLRRTGAGPRFLCLCGSVGIGKTVASAWAVAAIGGFGFRAPEMARAVEPWGREKPLGIDLRHRGVVVVDDLGTEPEVSPRFLEAFGRFVDIRMQQGLTVITSNLPRSEWRARYDLRVIDRLNHVGRALEISGPSRRRGIGGL